MEAFTSLDAIGIPQISTVIPTRSFLPGCCVTRRTNPLRSFLFHDLRLMKTAAKTPHL